MKEGEDQPILIDALFLVPFSFRLYGMAGRGAGQSGTADWTHSSFTYHSRDLRASLYVGPGFCIFESTVPTSRD